MAKNVRTSRLDPVYLLRRHAGTVFLFLALGLFGGVAYRSFVQSRRYSAEAEVTVRVQPAERAEQFNRDEKQAEWNDLLRGGRDSGLLGSNLRHAVKLAATADAELDADHLSEMLLGFGEGESFSASLFQNPFAARFAPTVMVTRRDLALNMDFQSLAVVIADLRPGEGTENADFGFFRDFLPETQRDAVIARADDSDPYFRVLSAFHRARKGSEAGSVAAAWKTATDELAARLDREAQFAGGGGFGEQAKRELAREITALPVLAANNIYHADHWYNGEQNSLTTDWAANTAVELTRPGSGGGTLRVAATDDLHPLCYPRDTVYTRTPPLVVATVLATLAAREEVPAPAAPVVEKTETPAPVVPVPVVEETETPEEPVVAATPSVTYREEVDEEANRERLAKITALEETIRTAIRDRDACLRRLNAGREDENRLSVEAMNARRRADRLRERYDDATVLVASTHDVAIPKETRKLLVRRNEITRRLNELLAYCTMEHPFVVAAFRELEAVEATLGEYAHTKNPESDPLTEAQITRAANLRVEWETASSAADDLEERRARQAEAVACLVEELEKIESGTAQSETDLAAAKSAPVPTHYVAGEMLRPAPTPRRRISETATAPVRTPALVPAPEPEPRPEPAPVAPVAEIAAPHLVFGALPADIPLRRETRDWHAVHKGLLSGLLAGLFVSLLREMLARHFRNSAEARRMVSLPVLASLPAYDAKSFRAAAATVKGELKGKGAGLFQFIPSPVELFEPPAEARRGRIAPAKRRPRIFAWVCGLVLILAAAFLYYRALDGFAQPRAAFAGELPMPAVTVPLWTEERAAANSADQWENMP